MGFADRDYNRDDEYREGFMADTPTCKKIIIATAVVFLLQILVTRKSTEQDFVHMFDGPQAVQSEYGTDAESFGDDAQTQQLRQQELQQMMRYLPEVSVVQEWMELDTNKVMQGQVWRLLTTALLHSRTSVTHILFNMALFYWFGRSLEAQYGSREFMLFYVIAAVLASVAFVGIQLLTGERVPGIGASGAVMGVVCLFTMWNPGYTIRMYFLFPIQMRYLLAIYVLYDLHPILLQLSGAPMNTGVAHAAHLGGLAFGFLYWRNGWQFDPLYERVASRLGKRSPKGGTSRPRRPITSPSQPVSAQQSAAAKAKATFDAKVDVVLAKISVEGEQNLTAAEREILLEASSRYRKRS